MHFFDTRIYRHLPKSAQAPLFAYLNQVAALCKPSADGWTDRTQSTIAKALNMSARSVQRYERACIDLKLIEVKHGQRGNRRRLRIVEVQELAAVGDQKKLPPLREWRHACRDCGDTRVVTLRPQPAALVNGVRTRAGASETRLKESLKQGRPSRPGASKLAGMVPERTAAATSSSNASTLAGQATRRATAKLLEDLSVGRRWWTEAVEIVNASVRQQGHEGTRALLASAREKFERVIDPETRGRRTLAYLRGARNKLEERHAPRRRAVSKS